MWPGFVFVPGSRRVAFTPPSGFIRRCDSIWSTRIAGSSIGGCTYHVFHPNGRAEERFPVNANEAESRRAARFDTLGMVGGSDR